MKKLAVLLLAAGVSLSAQGKEEDRLRACGTVVTEILNMPDVPGDLLHRAECVIVFPDVKKFAVGVGGSYGRGAMTCRTGDNFTGPWSAPTLMALEGASIGLQIGGQSTDYVLLVMNDRGATSVLSSKVKLGADASAAAGPKGLPAAVKTKLEVELATAANSADVKAKFDAVGFDVVASNSEQSSKFIGDEIARWKSVIEAGKITAE